MSKIHEFFYGSQELQEASAYVGQNKGEKLVGRKLRKFEESKKLMRRHNRKIMCVLIVFGMFLLFCIYFANELRLRQTAEAKIAEIESHFEKNEEKYQLLIKKHIQHKIMRKRCLDVIRVVLENRSFQYKNITKSPGRILRKSSNYSYKFMEFSSSIHGAMDSYAGILQLDYDFDTKNIMDISIIFHEVVHLFQVNTFLRGFSDEKKKKYASLLSNLKNVSDFNNELAAYMLQMELINALTDGKYKKTLMKSKIDFIYIAKIMQCSIQYLKRNHRGFVELSKLYFDRGGYADGVLSKQFFLNMKGMLRHGGFRLIKITKDLEVKEIK